MSGTTIQLLEPTKYKFNDVIANGFVTIPAAQNIDVTAYTTGSLLVRIHEISMGGLASVEVKVQQVLPSAQDPGRFFQGQVIGTVGVSNNDPAGRLLSQEISIPLGSYLTLLVDGMQGASTGTNVITISVDLSLKSC